MQVQLGSGHPAFLSGSSCLPPPLLAWAGGGSRGVSVHCSPSTPIYWRVLWQMLFMWLLGLATRHW